VSGLKGVERHLHSLRDIRAIMNSMKSLAYMEVSKLGRIMPAQRAVTRQIEEAAYDLLAFHPDVLPSVEPALHVCIVLGTERGFCGNLNQQLVEGLDAECPEAAAIVAIGHKLHGLLETRGQEGERLVLLDGAGVAEEVADILNEIVSELGTLQQEFGTLVVSALYCDARGHPTTREILPPFLQDRQEADAHGHPPQLNVAPGQLLMDLSDQYLYSVLFEILCDSLLNENSRRVSHLGDAVRYLDRQMTQLTHHANALRQEKITEEIEVLLLSVS
jgi:F-type H+-transporting ATPase subunit gamma